MEYIKEADISDMADLAQLAKELWQDNPVTELTDEISNLINCGKAKFFIKFKDGKAVGFAKCQLRYDYVEGASSSPVGYLEGIYVKEEFRKRGYSKQLLAKCEAYAKSKCCTEFASDCEEGNLQSFKFHTACGFDVANRIICFIKRL